MGSCASAIIVLGLNSVVYIYLFTTLNNLLCLYVFTRFKNTKIITDSTFETSSQYLEQFNLLKTSPSRWTNVSSFTSPTSWTYCTLGACRTCRTWWCYYSIFGKLIRISAPCEEDTTNTRMSIWSLHLYCTYAARMLYVSMVRNS